VLELTALNAAHELIRRGYAADLPSLRVRELSGGVSNVVLLVESESERFVVKQARGKLRVKSDWQCSVERIWREVDVLAAYRALLGGQASQLPEILWTDRELYAYAMTAAPAEARAWKEHLLAGDVSLDLAAACGSLLGTMHAASWQRSDLAHQFADRTFFEQLRLEPYFAFAAERYPSLSGPLQQLIVSNRAHPCALVHGDFSPKNLLVCEPPSVEGSPSLLLIDFEVGHFGDPSFDLGFFLTHLVLKAIHLPRVRHVLIAAIETFWQAYLQQLQTLITPEELTALNERTRQQLAGCLVARVHGKSPVDYLSPDQQTVAVELATRLFSGADNTWLATVRDFLT
jgi:aminoglycoside phosphotransferase (APT) family kinase protein